MTGTSQAASKKSEPVECALAPTRNAPLGIYYCGPHEAYTSGFETKPTRCVRAEREDAEWDHHFNYHETVWLLNVRLTEDANEYQVKGKEGDLQVLEFAVNGSIIQALFHPKGSRGYGLVKWPKFEALPRDKVRDTLARAVTLIRDKAQHYENLKDAVNPKNREDATRLEPEWTRRLVASIDALIEYDLNIAGKLAKDATVIVVKDRYGSVGRVLVNGEPTDKWDTKEEK